MGYSRVTRERLWSEPLASIYLTSWKCRWCYLWKCWVFLTRDGVESSTSDRLWYVRVSTKNFSKEEMQFSYRHSILKDNPHYFIIWACFNLSEKIEKYASDVDNLYFREHKQPKWNTCGSFFKNPSRDFSAGFLIESVWMKWYRHGWAYWSDIHANFLMSDGESCKPSDLIELMQITQQKVKQEKWFDLVNEVQIIK